MLYDRDKAELVYYKIPEDKREEIIAVCVFDDNVCHECGFGVDEDGNHVCIRGSDKVKQCMIDQIEEYIIKNRDDCVIPSFFTQEIWRYVPDRFINKDLHKELLLNWIEQYGDAFQQIMVIDEVFDCKYYNTAGCDYCNLCLISRNKNKDAIKYMKYHEEG